MSSSFDSNNAGFQLWPRNRRRQNLEGDLSSQMNSLAVSHAQGFNLSGQRAKIIMGLDYGTTFSGVSFCTSLGTFEDIEVINDWPSHRDTAWKTPTKIAYARENSSEIERDEWGYSVLSSYKCYMWTKLLLDRDAEITEYDDPSLNEIFGAGLMRLPSNKSAKQVCEDYLKGLSAYATQVMQRRLGSGMLEISPIECWITVPAIWTDKAQAATMEAAKSAGFGARSMDKIYVIPEPQAAALAALKPYVLPNALDPVKVGENILICDCGGGTVDITTYTIKATAPIMRFEELCMGTGGKCGSTYIDRNFSQWMIMKFGNAFTSVPFNKRCPGSRFMDAFESAKRNFDDPHDRRKIKIWPLVMNADDSSHYDNAEATVLLTGKDMQDLFDPVVDELIRLVTSQVNLARAKNHRNIDRIILVGGFGDSQYLFQKLKSWCSTHENIRLTCPKHCQAAIVKGAAMRGLEGTTPDRTYCRRHYGYVTNLPFEPGDPESHSFIDTFDGKKICLNRTKWIVSKGQSISELTHIDCPFTQSLSDGANLVSTLQLITCSQDQAPRYATDGSVATVGTVVMRFSSGDLSRAEMRWNPSLARMVRKFAYKVDAKFSPDKKLLEFEATAYGRRVGQTSIEFEGD